MDVSHIHPMVVHFPIALILTGFLVECASWIWKGETWLTKASSLLLILGTLGAIAGYVTGEFYTSELTGEAGKLKDLHALTGRLTMGMVILLSVVKFSLSRLKQYDLNIRLVVVFLYGIAAALTAYTAYLGGSLVMDHLIGI
ncbi:MAG: DUF2231 domain-containing protein [Bacteroidales bacterium]